MTTKHLDLGCGKNPRNPYFCDEVFGLDQSDIIENPKIQNCKIGLESFPFPADYFDSVSAYDLLEHIPRQAIDYSAKKINFPFVELMQEIWRVLKPDGKFFAFTPVYPSKEAFQDPTHVNIITPETHTYFCGAPGKTIYCSHYGFSGRFEALKVEHAYPAEITGDEKRSLKLRLRKIKRIYLQKKYPSHLLWELIAKK